MQICHVVKAYFHLGKCLSSGPDLSNSLSHSFILLDVMLCSKKVKSNLSKKKKDCSHWALPYTWYTDIVLFVKCLNAKLWNRFLFEISLFNLFTHFVDDFLRIRKVKQIKSLPACCIHRNTWFQYNMDSCWVNLLRAWIIATCGALPWELIHF